jgi:hypothetical protein
MQLVHQKRIRVWDKKLSSVVGSTGEDHPYGSPGLRELGENDSKIVLNCLKRHEPAFGRAWGLLNVLGKHPAAETQPHLLVVTILFRPYIPFACQIIQYREPTETGKHNDIAILRIGE